MQNPQITTRQLHYVILHKGGGLETTPHGYQGLMVCFRSSRKYNKVLFIMPRTEHICSKLFMLCSNTWFYTYIPHYNRQPWLRTYYVQGPILNTLFNVTTQWQAWVQTQAVRLRTKASSYHFARQQCRKITWQITVSQGPEQWSLI